MRYVIQKNGLDHYTLGSSITKEEAEQEITRLKAEQEKNRKLLPNVTDVFSRSLLRMNITAVWTLRKIE